MEGSMDWTQTLTIIISIGVPMLAGFAWIIKRVDDQLDRIDRHMSQMSTRLDRIEAILGIQGERIARIEGMLSPYEPRVLKEKK